MFFFAARIVLVLLALVSWSCRHDFPGGSPRDRGQSSEGGAWIDGGGDAVSPGDGARPEGPRGDGPRLEKGTLTKDRTLPPDRPVLPPDTRPTGCQSNTECPASTQPCAATFCDLANGVCKLKAANAGAQCRAATGPCDKASSCDGVSTTCPPNGFITGTTCRAAAGPCENAATCNGSSAACPANTFITGTTCRAAAGACENAATCNGSSAACPANTFISGTTCRNSTGPCDPAETCSGSAATCPGNVTWATQTATFKTVWGHDGFVGGDGGMGYQRVEAICYPENSASKINRGFVSFDTGSLPDAAKILSVDLTACYEGGPGSQQAELYTTSFSLPLAPSAFNAAVQLVKSLPNVTGTHAEALITSTVKTTGPTQFSLRYPVTDCLGGWAGKRWGSSTCPAMSNCPANSPWELKVSYCAP